MTTSRASIKVERGGTSGQVTIKFLRETPQCIRKIYQELNVEPTITHECPFELELSNDEIKELVISLEKI
jgi:hypothetical protein